MDTFLEFFMNLLQSSWFLSIILLIGILLLVVVFWLHRRNNQRRFYETEDKIHAQAGLVAEQLDKQFDTFKQGLQQMMTDMSNRIAANEKRTHAILNAIEELNQAIRKEYAEEDDEEEIS